MRILLFLATLGLLAGSASAQKATTAWYHVSTDGERARIVQAEQVVVVVRDGRSRVTAGEQQFDLRGPVAVAFAGLGERPARAGQPTSQRGTYEETTTTRRTGPDGTVTKTTTTKRTDTDTGDVVSETTTTTTPSPNGDETTTTRTTEG